MDAIAKHPHRGPRKCLPQHGGHPARLAGADLPDRAVHQPLDLLGRAAGQQLPLVDQGQAVAPLGFVQVGGGDEDRDPLPQQLVKDPPEVAARDGVHAVGRLVEEQDLRRVDQGAGQAELLLHPPGEIARQTLLEGREVAEGQQAVDLLLAPAARDAVDVGIEVDVLHDRQVAIEAEALAHVADRLLEGLGLAHDVMAGDPGIAAGRLQNARQEPHGRGLARAVGPHQPEDLRLTDAERKLVHGGHAVEGAAQAIGADGVHGGQIPSTKSQISNKSKAPNPNDQNDRLKVLDSRLGHWDFVIGICL